MNLEDKPGHVPQNTDPVISSSSWWHSRGLSSELWRAAVAIQVSGASGSTWCLSLGQSRGRWCPCLQGDVLWLRTCLANRRRQAKWVVSENVKKIYRIFTMILQRQRLIIHRTRETEAGIFSSLPFIISITETFLIYRSCPGHPWLDLFLSEL